MPQGLSMAVLPAAKVQAATQAALEQLRKDRETMADVCRADWIRQWRSLHKVKSLMTSDAWIIEEMPDGMKMWPEHRKDDEQVLIALWALAAATFEHDAKFTVEITADDFRLIHAFYQRKES